MIKRDNLGEFYYLAKQGFDKTGRLCKYTVSSES